VVDAGERGEEEGEDGAADLRAVGEEGDDVRVVDAEGEVPLQEGMVEEVRWRWWWWWWMRWRWRRRSG
jgi:hypothetical protein